MDGFKRYVIRRDGEYLVSIPYSDTLYVRWSENKFDAAKLRRYSTARKIADRVNGGVYVLDTLTGVIS